MKTILILYSFLFSTFVLADDGMLPIVNTTALQEWCKNKSAGHFLAKDITPYNWSFSHWTKGNVLHVKGHWKINGSKQIVNCRILKDAERKYAIIEMPSQTLFAISYEQETPINNSKELDTWCKNKSAQYYIKKELTPYNWTSSTWEKGHFLTVKGRWKINNSPKAITCRIRKGVSEKYAHMEIALIKE